MRGYSGFMILGRWWQQCPSFSLSLDSFIKINRARRRAKWTDNPSDNHYDKARDKAPLILKVPVSKVEPLKIYVISAFAWEEAESRKQVTLVALMALESVTGQCVLAAKLGADPTGSHAHAVPCLALPLPPCPSLPPKVLGKSRPQWTLKAKQPQHASRTKLWGKRRFR